MAEGEARAGGERGGGGEEAKTGAGDDVDIDIGAAVVVQEEGGRLGSVTQYDFAEYGPSFARSQVDTASDIWLIVLVLHISSYFYRCRIIAIV